jgi:alpha-L-rhamnosidase
MRNVEIVVAIFFVAIIGAFAACNAPKEAELKIKNLKVESSVNPIGIDVVQPRFSWQLESPVRGAVQTAYQILVATSPERLNPGTADLWDSGKTESGETVGISYGGQALQSGQTCYWKLKVWDAKGGESAWTEPAQWSMGLLAPEDWQGQWIGFDQPNFKMAGKGDFTRLAARYLRKEISIQKEIKKATAYVCGQGLFEWYINGNKIGNQVLAPALSEYAKRSYYMTFDVTSQLQQGQNALGVILGNGRFFAPRAKEPIATNTYGFPKLMFQLNLEYADGTTESVVSDPTWKLTANGPIIANNEYDGEEYDATKEMPGWNKVGFDDSAWQQAQVVAPASPKLVAQPSAPIVVHESVKPVSVKEQKPGVFIFDMGQNMVGWVSLKVQGPRGTQVKMRFAETLQPDGSLYLANIRSAKVTDIYTLKGDGVETYEPRFTYHGFRFVELTGFPGTPDLTAIEGKVVYDDLPLTGRFETSDPMINTIYKNAYWGIRGNYRSIPTDCPQRDERQGWLGDRATGSKGESFIFDNSRLYAKWMQDIDDAQREDGCLPSVAPSYWSVYPDNVTWPAAYPIISGMLYDQFADAAPIRVHYDSFRRYMLYMKDNFMKKGVITKDCYGDWCMPPEKQELIHSKDPARKTDGEILSTTYYYHLLSLMERFADMLNKPEDVAEYKQWGEEIYQAYNKKFFDEKKNCYGNNTATANLLSLAHNLVPEDKKQAVFQHIVDKTENDFNGHISTGLVGAQWIMRILTEYGRPDIALKLATNKDYPSWGYMAENGATTIWELWNGNTADPAMNSGNHVMLLGDLVIWYYENLAGIKSDPATPGFKHLLMKPTPVGDLKSVKASYESVRGLIRSEWNKTEAAFNWQITIPANTSATVYIPAKSEQDVKENNIPATSAEGVRFLRMEDGKAVFEVQSGTYSFSSVI